jgi:hypothetical protein
MSTVAERINREAAENGRIEALLLVTGEINTQYCDQLHWLTEQRDEKNFVPSEEYIHAVR